MLAWATSRAARTSGAISLERPPSTSAGGDPEVVELGAVEAGGELAERDVAARAHVGEERPHLVDGRLDLGLGRGSRPRRSPSTPRRSSRCSTRRGYVRPAKRPRNRFAHAMHTGADAASTPPSSPSLVDRARRAHRARHRHRRRAPGLAPRGRGRRPLRGRAPPRGRRAAGSSALARPSSQAGGTRRGRSGERPRLARPGGGSRRRRDRRQQACPSAQVRVDA